MAETPVGGYIKTRRDFQRRSRRDGRNPRRGLHQNMSAKHDEVQLAMAETPVGGYIKTNHDAPMACVRDGRNPRRGLHQKTRLSGATPAPVGGRDR